jgi:hypothetical protein
MPMGQLNLCCSKKIVLASYTTTAVLTLLTVVGAFFSQNDVTPILTVTSLSWGETAACNAFYFWKAKHENRIKLTENMVKELADQYGIEAVANLTNIILRD